MEMTICIGPFGILPNGSLLTFAFSLGSGLWRTLADAGDPNATTTASAQIPAAKARRRRRKASRLYSVRNVSPSQRNFTIRDVNSTEHRRPAPPGYTRQR